MGQQLPEDLLNASCTMPTYADSPLKRGLLHTLCVWLLSSRMPRLPPSCLQRTTRLPDVLILPGSAHPPQQIYIYIYTYKYGILCVYHIIYIYIYLWVARIQLKVICPTQTSMRRLISKLPYLTITHLCWKMHKLLNQVYPNISPSPSKTSAGFVGEWLIT